jgi:hypothetical protein
VSLRNPQASESAPNAGDADTAAAARPVSWIHGRGDASVR